MLVQLHEITPEAVLPLHPEGQPGQIPTGIGGIDVHQVKIPEFQRQHTALRLFILFQPVPYGQRFDAGKYRSAGIAFFDRVIPILPVRLPMIQLNLPLLELGLLQAENIRIGFLETLHKSFIHTGPQTVHIP
ncbi:hypothetical protein D3C75_736780 [compost metagenome]